MLACLTQVAFNTLTNDTLHVKIAGRRPALSAPAASRRRDAVDAMEVPEVAWSTAHGVASVFHRTKKKDIVRRKSTLQH